MKCPFKFGNYDFEGAEDCIGSECGMHNLCNAETEITAVEFDALDEHAQALERENAELRKLCANDTLADESDVSEASVDANDVNADTREELEADVHDLFWGDNLQRYARQKGYLDGSGIEVDESITTTNHEGHVTATTVMHLLARQAAITEREWIDTECAKCGARENERDRDFAELQARVDELTEQLETAHAKNRSLRQHIAKMQEGRHGWHVKGAELQKKVDELMAENAKLSSELTAARSAHAKAEHDVETYREKLGRVLDMVQEMERVGTLVDQEGNVIG